MMFSIIIPIYNAELYLRRCLQSVMEQEYTDFEVLMINDGSIDGSELICLEYQHNDSRFHYFYQENSGVSVARNNGMDHAQGEYITFLDSDDIYFPTYLSSFVKIMKNHPNSGHYWCAFVEYTNNDSESGKIYQMKSVDGISILSRGEIMNLHANSMDGAPWNKIFSRKILGDIRMVRGLSLGEDMLFNWEYLDKNPNTTIVVNNTPQYGYFLASENSLDHKYRKNLREIFDRLIDSMGKYLAKWNVSEQHWKQYYNTIFYMYERVLRNTFRTENTQKLKEKYQTNDEIMRCIRYKESLKKMDCYIHPLYRFAFMSGNYRFVIIIDWLSSITHRRK